MYLFLTPSPLVVSSRQVRDALLDEKSLQEKVRGLCDTLDLKPKMVFQPVRVAVCGNMVSPPLFESFELMERADVVARIDSVLARVFGK